MTALHTWHSLNQLHLEFPHMLSTCWLLFLHSSVQLSQLGWSQVNVESRSSDAALDHSPSWSNSPYTAWMCVGSSCWITNDSPTKCKWNGVLLQNAVVAMMVKCALNSKWITDSVTSKAPPHHHTSFSMLHGWNHTCRDHPYLTKTQWLEPKI